MEDDGQGADNRRTRGQQETNIRQPSTAFVPSLYFRVLHCNESKLRKELTACVRREKACVREMTETRMRRAPEALFFLIPLSIHNTYFVGLLALSRFRLLYSCFAYMYKIKRGVR